MRDMKGRGEGQQLIDKVVDLLGVEQVYPAPGEYLRRAIPLQGPNEVLDYDGINRVEVIDALLQILLAEHAGLRVDAQRSAAARLRELDCVDMHVDTSGPEWQGWEPTFPFFCEATLYPLVGKEQARTILALLGRLDG